MESSKDANVTIDRRKFIFRTTQAVAGTVLAAGAISSIASDPTPVVDDAGVSSPVVDNVLDNSDPSFVMNSMTPNVCGTCQYWGAQRRVSEDGKSVTIDSLGWCNNRKSPNFRKTTGPQTGPMKVWEQWAALTQE